MRPRSEAVTADEDGHHDEEKTDNFMPQGMDRADGGGDYVLQEESGLTGYVLFEHLMVNGSNQGKNVCDELAVQFSGKLPIGRYECSTITIDSHPATLRLGFASEERGEYCHHGRPSQNVDA